MSHGADLGEGCFPGTWVTCRSQVDIHGVSLCQVCWGVWLLFSTPHIILCDRHSYWTPRIGEWTEHRGLNPESPGLEPMLSAWCCLCEEGREGTSGHEDKVPWWWWWQLHNMWAGIGTQELKTFFTESLWEPFVHPGSNPGLLSHCIFCCYNTVGLCRNCFLLCARNCPRCFMSMLLTFLLTPGKLWPSVTDEERGSERKGVTHWVSQLVGAPRLCCLRTLPCPG